MAEPSTYNIQIITLGVGTEVNLLFTTCTSHSDGFRYKLTIRFKEMRTLQRNAMYLSQWKIEQTYSMHGITHWV